MEFKLECYELQELMKIKYGKNQKKVEDGNGEFPILGTGGVMGYANKFLYDKPSVLIGRKGSISKVKYIDKPFWTVDTLFYTEINENKALPLYIYYYLSQIDFNYYNEGTTIPSLRTETLNKIEIYLPNIKVQNKIVDFLSNIDKKIELNTKIISNLEQLSQTLFKQWFIDFEFPNEEGKPYKSSGGEMVESELGEIPTYWSILRLETIFHVKNGKKIDFEDRKEKGYKIFGSNGVIGYTDKILYTDASLIIGRVGANCGSIARSLDPCWISDNAILCIPKNIIYFNFLYILLKKMRLKEHAGGSAQPLINQSILKALKFISPPEILIGRFHSITYKNTQLAEDLKKENQKLSELRDILLPKLLSGEIEIPDDLEV